MDFSFGFKILIENVFVWRQTHVLHAYAQTQDFKPVHFKRKYS